MDLALHFACLKQGFNGDRRNRLSSACSMRRFKNGYVCCKRLKDEGTSNPSKVRQEEIISIFRRIQSSITKERESRGGEQEKNRDGSIENESLSKAVLDVLEKSRNKTEGDTVAKEPQKRQVKVARPPSSSGPRDKPPESKEEKAPLIETMKLAELKEVAKNKGIKGYSKMKKGKLLELLKSF